MKLISTKICKTGDIGVNDNLFGGIMLAWLDESAGILAANVCCDHNVITLKMDEVLFKHPVKVKEQIRIYGKVENMGKTSVSLYLEARRANLKNESEEVVCSTKMIFVRVDPKGKPVLIKAC
jgi:acyl-CoA thioesterase YciA